MLNGELEDPSLTKATLAYRPPDSDFEIKLSLEEGENFDTYAEIDRLKFAVGWKR